MYERRSIGLEPKAGRPSNQIQVSILHKFWCRNIFRVGFYKFWSLIFISNVFTLMLFLLNRDANCRVSILGIPKTRELAPTLTSSDRARRINMSRTTPWVQAPSRPTLRTQFPSRLTPRPRGSRPRPRAPSRPTSRPRAPSRPTLGCVRGLRLAHPQGSRALSRPTRTHIAANHSRSRRMALGQNSNIREETGTTRCNPRP